MRYSITGTMNLRWSEAVEAVQLAESLGFDAFYGSDHLRALAGFDPAIGNLDSLTLITALAPLTTRIRLGCLVSPITQRHPVTLVRALQTLDIISEGRAEIGLGAGWDPEEHHDFGLAFPRAAERVEQLDAACSMIRHLWPSTTPVEHDGRFPLRGAKLDPPPTQPEAPILVAGASDATIEVAARHATRWNALGSPAYLRDRITRLRAAEQTAGRTRTPTETTVMLPTVLSRDTALLQDLREQMSNPSVVRPARAQARHTVPGEEPSLGTFVGRPEELAAAIAQYEACGVERVILTVPRPWDPTRLIELTRAAGIS